MKTYHIYYDFGKGYEYIKDISALNIEDAKHQVPKKIRNKALILKSVNDKECLWAPLGEKSGIKL